MTGFETYDASGKLTFSTRDSTYLVVRTKIIPAIRNHPNNKHHVVTTGLPADFTDIKVTMYPTTTLQPSTGATMPSFSYVVRRFANSVVVTATVRQPANRVYPPCVLVILGN